MADDNIYRDLSPVGNLRTSTPRGRYHRLLRGTNDLTSPVERKPIIDVIHRGTSLSFTPSLSVGGG